MGYGLLESDMSSTNDVMTKTFRSKLNNPVSSPEFGLYAGLDGGSKRRRTDSADSGGKITFYGKDPIVPSCVRFGTMSAIGLAAKDF